MSKAVPEPTLSRLAVIREDGSRNDVHPADVKGRFTRWKPWVYGALIAIYAALPWIPVGGHPAVLLDIPGRRFYLFGLVFNAQDGPLLFFLLTGVGFTLILLSALFGRVWCGWACPQTVFLDGVFRKVERLIEGNRGDRLRLDAAPWTATKLGKRALKHGIFLAASLIISHIFISYFVSIPRLYEMMKEGAASSWTTFLWMSAITGLLYFNFAWFREQLCLIVCPYGRLQSALQDQDTLIIGYDEKRGEPRGKAKDPSAGDCVDCRRCIVVCPTGIDIRQGLQMECIGCAACIDACDDVMTRLGREPGLIRYDSQRGLTEGVRRFFRPRVLYYAVAGLVGLSVATLMFSRHEVIEANVLRIQGSPYVVEGDVVQNRIMLHVINKQPERAQISVLPVYAPGMEVLLPQPTFELPSLGSHQVPVVVTVPLAGFTPGRQMELRVLDELSHEERLVRLDVLGPPVKRGGSL